jgi:hypothetical protein
VQNYNVKVDERGHLPTFIRGTENHSFTNQEHELVPLSAKSALGGFERWFNPRGQDLDFFCPA